MSRLTKALSERKLKKLLRKTAEDEGTLGEWARENNIAPQVVSAWLNGKQGAGLQIPEALGYKPVTVYIPVRKKK